MVFIQIWCLEYSREKKFIQDLLRCRSNKKFKACQGPCFRTALKRLWQRCDWWYSSCLKRKFWPHFSVSYPFQRFIPVSAFYPHFSVLFTFIPIWVFYPHFSVLSPIQRFILISVFYPQFSVLSPFQRFILISAFYLHFSVLSPFLGLDKLC